MSDTDRDWERWGGAGPYFGAYSEDRSRGAAMSDRDRSVFFASGDAHVQAVLAELAEDFPHASMPMTDPPLKMYADEPPALLGDLRRLGFSARYRQECWRDAESTTLIALHKRLP
jgi:hypothetical protein